MKTLHREMENLLSSSPEKSRTVRFLANTATKDRHDTIVLPQGVQLENFWKNPIFCWSHLQAGLATSPEPEDVIGRVTTLEVSEEGLVIEVEFAPEEINPKAERCYKAVQAGFLRAVSIGFDSLEEHDEGNGKEKVTVISKWELLEVSLVILGSNPDALALRNLIQAPTPTRGCAMTKQDAFHKLSLSEDASKDEVQKAYRDYADKTDDDEDTKRAVREAVGAQDDDKENREAEDPKEDSKDDKESDEKRSLLRAMSKEMRSLREELHSLRSEVKQAENLKTLEIDVHRWIKEGRYPAEKRAKLLELHKQGKAKELVESIERGTFSSKRMFSGGDPWQEGAEKPSVETKLTEFDQRVFTIFEKQGLRLNKERFLRDKADVEMRSHR